jgi:hypothetical protein
MIAFALLRVTLAPAVHGGDAAAIGGAKAASAVPS